MLCILLLLIIELIIIFRMTSSSLLINFGSKTYAVTIKNFEVSQFSIQDFPVCIYILTILTYGHVLCQVHFFEAITFSKVHFSRSVF